MRDMVIGAALFVVLIAIAAMRGISATHSSADAAAATARAVPSRSADSGPGFAVCAGDDGWQRPSESTQRARLGADARYDGLWTDDSSPAAEEFHSPAVLYDGSSTSGLGSIVELTGLWTVWPTKTCWTQQPQVFLFGYEPVRYDATGASGAELRVRPASGYRIVVLTGPIRPHIAVIGDHALTDLTVPSELVTPIH